MRIAHNKGYAWPDGSVADPRAPFWWGTFVSSAKSAAKKSNNAIFAESEFSLVDVEMSPPKNSSRPENRSVGAMFWTDGVVKFVTDRIEELYKL